jgi:hypothetical protein
VTDADLLGSIQGAHGGRSCHYERQPDARGSAIAYRPRGGERQEMPDAAPVRKRCTSGKAYLAGPERFC